MNKESLAEALQKMRQASKKRKFSQSVEMMINFKFLDYKKSENQVDVRVKMPHSTSKSSAKTLLFARNPSFAEQAKARVDKVIMEEQIPKLNKKEIAEIINEYDLLLAEGPAMLTVGKHLGQQLAPKGRMPKPVLSSMTSIEDALKEVGGAVRITNKKGKPMPLVQVLVGDEKMSDAQLTENMLSVYTEVSNILPNKEQNIKSIFVKETMGPSIKVGGAQ